MLGLCFPVFALMVVEETVLRKVLQCVDYGFYRIWKTLPIY